MNDMPRHPSFEKIYRRFIDRYGEEEGQRLYYAWLNKNGYDDTKPFPNQRMAESFKWLDPAVSYYKRMGNGKLYKVHAIHVGASQNMNVYGEEELKLAARSLAERPLNLNHARYSGFQGVNKVVDAEYEDGVVEAVIYVEDRELQRMIEDGEIEHVSIEAKARSAEWADGFAIQGLVFTGLALLTGDVPPGDPLTKIIREKNQVTSVTEQPRDEEAESEVMETKKECEAAPPASTPTTPTETNQPEPFTPASAEPKAPVTVSSTVDPNVNVSFTTQVSPPPLEEAEPLGEKTVETLSGVEEGEWTAAYINDLPDDAFAYIEPGGKKDETGRTTPRSLRHLPYRNARGEVDADHLRAALAYLDRTNIPDEARRQALRRLCAAAKEAGVESEKCREELGEACPVKEKESVEAVDERPQRKRKEIRMEEMKGKMSVEEVLVESQRKEEPAGKGLVPEPAVAEAVIDADAKRRRTIVERLTAGSIREQWEAPMSIPTAPTAGLAAVVNRSEAVLDGKPGDTVNIPYVKDFDSDVITVGGSLTEKTSLYATATTTLKEAGAYTQIPYADVEKLTEGILAKIEANAAKSVLRAVDKHILDTLIADANVPELDHSTATVYFDADYIPEAMGKMMAAGKDVQPGDAVLVLNAYQYDALLRDIAASQSLTFARPDVVQDGVVTKFMGVQIVVSNYLPEHDATNHKYSAYLIHRDAIVYAPKRELLIETERDTVNRKIKMTWTHTFGVAVVDKNSIVEIKTGKPA